MEYVYPSYYPKFQCTGGTCPDTCCAGWEITIDDRSLMRYRNYSGAFGNRIANEGAGARCRSYMMEQTARSDRFQINRYAREIEHSDVNLDRLEEILGQWKCFHILNLAAALNE